ncbi:hypothetical protein OU800_08905 [Pseudomonas sp. GOM7]|uniref:hypothetical protein n=1 Tax=Pseudomonas sp. GOM7 TaxID=2998079 RepID=UPI00227AB647|nr:hypothetical protein [Pseudomonas sp. GOM7]WAJ39330.1 hypothetical protein OU800_08905 [Pseudomonas sp. GOM7]
MLYSLNCLAANDEGKAVDIDIQWGAYYLTKEDNQYRVFRLLDFNRYAYHAAIFKETFATKPTKDKLLQLTPFVGHAPIDAKALLQDESIQLLASAPLKKEDLEGYRYYLEEQGMSADEMEELIQRIMEFSTQPPLQLRLEIIDNELKISQR